MVERPSAMQGIAGSIPGDRLLQKKVNNSWYFNYMCGLGQTASAGTLLKNSNSGIGVKLIGSTFACALAGDP